MNQNTKDPSLLQNRMQLQLVATLISLAQALTIRESHLKSYQSNNPLSFLFFIFLCIGGIVYLVYRCRRRSMHMPPPPPPLPQQPIYHPNIYPVQPNLYANFQNGPIYPNFPPPRTSSSYVNSVPPVIEDDITRAANIRANASQWSEPDYLAQNTLREPCSYCSSFSRYGEEPRLMLNCSRGHVFHIVCLNQFRVKERMGSSMACPTCREPTSEYAKLFCFFCKRRSVSVDLCRFSDSDGVINTTALLTNYGQRCTDCKNL